jgi:5-methyltetrahydropteroyltriglutamate--homocysteine methyltransferase
MGSRILTHNLGYPRMGALRQLKKSLEAYWKGRELEADLHRSASDLRRMHWLQQKEAGIDLIPSNDQACSAWAVYFPEIGENTGQRF